MYFSIFLFFKFCLLIIRHKCDVIYLSIQPNAFFKLQFFLFFPSTANCVTLWNCVGRYLINQASLTMQSRQAVPLTQYHRLQG